MFESIFKENLYRQTPTSDQGGLRSFFHERLHHGHADAAHIHLRQPSPIRRYGNMAPKIYPMKSLPVSHFLLSRRTGVPQNVNNMTTSMPMAAATVSITNATSILSRSPLNTIIGILFSEIAFDNDSSWVVNFSF
jgi:hypothetical protein